MSSKRKWDQAAPEEFKDDPESPSKVAKVDESKNASTAAAVAAIAAKIAAQFSSGAVGGGNGLLGPKDIHDGEFTQDIDINDLRNRYMLTKGSTQQQVRHSFPPLHDGNISRTFVSIFFQIHDETGASVSTKGIWYPDRTKATEKDPPLYLHISANTKEMLQRAIDKVNELIAVDMGSLVEDKGKREKVRLVPRDMGVLCALTSSQRKWPEEKIFIGLESIRNFNVRAKVVGPTVSPRVAHMGCSLRIIYRACLSNISSKKQGPVCR